MDNKQAAATLRLHKEAAHNTHLAYATEDDLRAGADALEMLEWLFEEGPWGRFCWRVMYDEWNGEGTFRAFCEAKFKESRNAT